MFLIGLYEAARAHTQVAPTYSYLFDYNGKYNQITNYGYPASEWGNTCIFDNQIVELTLCDKMTKF